MNDTPIPELINDRYRVLRLLGRGGIGQVLLVEDTRRDGRRMALKTLLPQTTDHLLTTGFRQEFAELAKLEHPNLAKAYDFGKISGSSEYFFTTEFVPGVELMAATIDATVNELINVSAQILRALGFIHDHGILHNDLKPANILVAESEEDPSAGKSSLSRLESLAYDYKGRVKIIDFGLISREHTAWKHVLGTVRYISPERIRRGKADRRSDLYSIGVVLYLLFARRPPFEARSTKTLLKMHLEEAPTPLRAHRPDLPDSIVDLVHKLLEKSPDDRFQSAEEALDFLSGSSEAIAEGGAVPASEWKGGRITAGALLHRDQEVKRLREVFDAAGGGHPETHGIVIQGPSGIGKSRLVDELRGAVQVSGGAFVAVGSAELGGDLKPFADALLASLQTSGVSGLDKVERLFADAAGHGGGLAQALEKVILWFTKSRPMLLHVDGLDQASKTARQFTIELLHAADSRTRDGGEMCRLLLVVSRRSSEGRADLGVTRIPIIELEPFDDEESAAFLRQAFGQEDIPPEVLRKLVEISEGNPLFLLELSNQLVEEGLVTFSGARWRFPDTLEGIVLPASLDGVFEEKISSLNERLVDVASWIAASGRPLDKRVLLACTRLSPDRLDSHLETLSRKNLVLARTLESGVVDLQLTHSRSREILLARLEEEDRQRLHQRIAQNISAVFPRGEEEADTLAEHWLLSGNEAGFLRFAPRAAEILRERGDLETAVSYHQRIAESVPETALARKLQSLGKLAEMHEFLWDLDACYEDLAAMLELGRKLMKPRDRALLLRRMGAVELARHRPAGALELIEEARSLLAEAGPLHRLSIDAPRCTALWFGHSGADALESLERCLETLGALPEPRDDKEKMLLLGAANHVATFCHLIGRLEIAEDLFRKNLEILQKIDQPQALGATRCALGGVLLDRGLYASAEAELRAALEIGKETGDRRTLSRARERLGEQYVLSARFREALQITQVSLQDAERMKNPGAIASSLRTLGRIHFYADETAEAGDALYRAHRISAENGDVINLALGRLELAGIHLRENEIDRGMQHLKVCRVEAAPYGLPLVEGLLAKWTFVHAWRSERVRDEESLDQARSIFSKHGYHGELVALLLLECEAAIDLGDIERARDALARLESVSEGFERPDVRSEADYLLASIEGSGGDPGKAAAACERARSSARAKHKMRLVRRLTELEERGMQPAVGSTEETAPWPSSAIPEA